MTVFRAALLLGCLFAAAGQVVDKYGNPCLPGGTLPPKQMSVGGQVALGLGATAAAALAGSVAVIETNPKFKKSVKKTAGTVQTAIEGVFTSQPPPRHPRAHHKLAAMVVRRSVTFDVNLPPNMPAAAAVNNPAIVKAVVDNIARDTGLPPASVDVKLTVTTPTVANGRRLSKANIEADIQASIPATNSAATNQAIAKKLNAVTPKELSLAVDIVVNPTTTLAVTPTPWDSLSGSGGVSSASLTSDSLLTGSGSGSSFSSGSNASGSSGFYMAIFWWLLLFALVIGFVAFIATTRKPKRRIKKKSAPEPEPVVESGVEQDYLLPPLVPQNGTPFVAEVQAGYSMVSPTAQYDYAAPAAMITPRTIVTSGYNYAADYATPPMPGPYTTAYSSSFAAPVVVETVGPPSYVQQAAVSMAAPMVMDSSYGQQVMAAPMVTEVQSGYNMTTPQAAPAIARGGIRGTMTTELFNAIDNNRDGVITRAEFREAIAGNIIRVPGQ